MQNKVFNVHLDLLQTTRFMVIKVHLKNI